MNKYVELSRKLLGELKVRKRRISEFTQPIAVVGLACRFPGGDGLEGFWRLLESGGDAVTEARGRPIGGGMPVYGETKGEGSPAHWGGFVEDVDLFDAEFFRIAPVEARLLDPQQRLLLETSWQALESAGMDPGGLKGSRTGVYAGIATHDYADLMAASGEADSGSVYIATGNTGSTAIGRVAFALGLEGPAVAVDTACSSSLVAVHQAVSGLQRGEADLALAGGVNVLLSPFVTETFRNGGMLSPDGRCKTFDASADGFVRGEGCGVVVLKRLRDAEAAGDRIWGVVRGSAVNHDGASAGLTVPNGLAQERVIGDALKQAGVEPSEVDYLEAHGTGTELGDPIEVDAAAAVYGAGRDPAQPLLLGSVKTNIGHLETAAGVAGLIKVLLSMGHGVIPKHLHFRQPNPHVDWERLPVRVASEPEAWPRREGRPARAGISSFGFSGTNAHVLVEEHGSVAVAGPRHSGESRNPVAGGAGPAVAVGWPEGASEFRPAKGSAGVTGARERRLLALSGRTEEALHALAGRYVEWLEERAELLTPVEGGGEGPSGRELLADMAWTAGVGRSHHGCRAGLTFLKAEELREKLAELAGGSEAGSGVSTARGTGGAPKVGFLFTGQGSQWPGMGRELYEQEPVFRAVLDRCEQEVKRLRGESLLEVMFEAGQGPELDHTRWTQPALYALEAGLAAMWGSVGVRPAVVLGHSVGEVAAAYAAGVLTLEEGMRLAARRGELMGSLPVDGPRAGSMAAVFAPADRVGELAAEVNEAVRGGIPGAEGDPPFAGEALSVAGYNGGHVVVSGLTGAVDAMLERCRAAGLRAERLRVSHGFHSGLMEPVLDELAGLLEGVEARAPEVELVSNVTGAVLGSGERMDGTYWRRQAREPVAFGAGVAALAGSGVEVLVELGPGPVLGRMAALAWPGEGHGEGDESSSGPGSRSPVVVTSLSGRSSGGVTAGRDGGFPEAVAEVYAAGVDLDFAGLFAGEERRRVLVPGYPFQRQRHWADPPRRRRRAGEADHPLLGQRRDSAGGETTFETDLYASEPGWLRDHRVFGHVAAPAALYGAMALSALAAAARSGRGGGVEGMEIHAPLLLPEGDGAGRAVQVVVSAAEESGRREVKIYSKGDEEEKWTLHAAAQTAGAVEEAVAGEAVDVEGLKEGLGADEAAEFYRAVGKMGVELGPSFRTVTGLWTGPGEAVGEVRLREGLANGETGLHPVLLDGCFQVLGAALWAGAMGSGGEGGEGDAGEREAVYLPFGWERLWVGSGLKDSVTCRARVRGGGEKGEAGEAATADLWLYGESGEMVGEVRGLALKRASRDAFLSVGVRTEELLYVPEWREAPYEGEVKGASFLKPPEEAVRGGGSVSEHLEGAGVTVAGVRELQGELERVARGYAARALEELGWRREAGEEVSEDELRERFGVVKDQEHLFGRVLWLAAEAGLLERVEGERGRWRVPAGSSGEMGDEGLRDPGGLASRLVERHGRVVEVEAGLLSRCGGSLAEVLQGRTEPLGLLFAEGDSGAAELYGEAPVSRALSDLLAGVLGSAVSGLPEGRVLRVLEVGAGTGGTTQAVLERLPAGEFEYEYTDVSAGFFAGARERFEEWGEAMEYRVLDLEGEPGEQGFEEHGYDVVLAGNVLHATRDIVATLRRCQWLLAPGGLLVAQEVLRRQGLWDLTFGMLAGWWRFVEGGDGYREESPLMGGDEWRGALREAGYEDVAVVGEAEGLDYGVIVAQSPEEVAETGGVWVLSSDAGVEGLELAKELSERKQRVLLAVDEKWGQEGEADAAGVEVFRLEQRSRENWRTLLEGVVGEGGGVRGVVHVRGMSGHGEGAGSQEMAADVRESLGSGLALVQGLLDAGVEPGGGLWLVTRGGQVLGGEGGGELVGSVMWGFGRTLWWEAGQLRARLVDLDPAEPGSGFGVLADELLNPDREREIAYRGGVRQVLRLARADRAGKAAGEGGLLRGDGTYLVTGGMGGIGLEVAGWLAERGAGRVVLNGRREPDEAAQGVIDELRGRGVDVRVELADVTDGDAVAAMVERVEREAGPLVGVIHSAGVLWDGALVNQEWERFEPVLWPKVLGAWHLHRATAGRGLELFVLFSSMAGVLGNAGQANHTAANAFLDQLARRRRETGLAGQSIAWGAWSGVGKAEVGRDRIGGRLVAAGGGWMTPGQGLGVLERVVGGGEATSVATMMDWGLFGAAVEEVPPLLEDLVTVSGLGEGASRAGELLDRVREAAASEREGLLLEFVQGELQEVLQTGSLPAAGVGFFDLGMDSLMAVDFRNRLNRGLGEAVVLSSTVVFDHGSAAALARHLAEELGVRGVSEGVLRRGRVERGGEDGIAVVGMACRFPGGGGVEGFWRLLDSGGDAVTNGRVNPPGGPYGVVASGDGPSIRWGGFIEDVELFDAEFFRIAPVEARLLDPQQRLLLETCWEALESAGIDAGRLRGSPTGVYAGISNNDYAEVVTREDAVSPYMVTGNSGATAIGRVAFTLGLEGPAVAVDTACSSSLVAVHQAVLGLQRGDADLALAGGVNVLLSATVTESVVRAGMLSPDGRCKTFDASANGFVRGEGCGVVVLKRLRDAEADGDRIWGVIRGSAINHDGASAGLTVPNGSAQERVIGAALGRAGLEPWEVDYLEAHGTGTELGDPIEVHAAAAVYGTDRDAAQPLRVGSVKTNVGHLEAAAGVSGLIKVLLSMAHGVIPKHLHFREPNPHVDWERLPLRVASEPEAWPRREGRPARAAVSSFGFSGTNAHVVVEGHGSNGDGLQAGPAVVVPWPEGASGFRPGESGSGAGEARERRLLALSGRTEEALRALAARYADWLKERLPWSADGGVGEPDSAGKGLLADVAWTAGVGRSHLERRAGVTFAEAGELRERLAALASGEGRVSAGRVSGAAPKVGFLFTGQGSQWAGMGRDMYEREPLFRAVLDRCEEEFRGLRGESLLAVMFGEGEEVGCLDDTEWTQPALYALEAGLAAMWASVGVRPAAVLGHSVGEIAAAHVAGVFSLEAGLRFAARRGELMGTQPAAGAQAGAMAAVFAPARRVEGLVAEVNAGLGCEGLSMAAYNGGHQVVSGQAGAVEDLLERCEAAGVRAERLRVSHGFHSALMEPILEDLEGLLSGADVSAPEVALVSDVTGAVLGAGELMDGVYWRRQAREPVAFEAGVAALAGMGVDVLVELGPRPVLGRMAALAWPAEDGDGAGLPSESPGPAVLPSLTGEKAGMETGRSDGGFVEAVAGAYEAGVALSFEGLFTGEERRRVSLPGYPFQRQRYWADAPRRRRLAGDAGHPLLGERRESARGETTFETELYATEPAWLSDHRVFGQVVAPGAMHGTLAFVAASLAAVKGRAEGVVGEMSVADMRFHAPLVLPEGEERGLEPGRTLQVVLGAADGTAERTVEIYSKGVDEAGWTLHAEARTGLGAAWGDRTDMDALRGRLSERDTVKVYRRLAAAGVDLGASLRAVESLWADTGEVLGNVSVPEEVKDRGSGLHPVLLDGCFQVLAAALGGWTQDEGNGVHEGEGADALMYLPFGWERLWAVEEMPERVACHARVRGVEAGGDRGDEGEGSPAEVVTADLRLYGDDGRLVGEVSGLVLKRADRGAFLSGVVRAEDLLYAPVWREAALRDVGESLPGVREGEGESSAGRGVWVLSSGGSGGRQELAEELCGRGERVVLVVDEAEGEVAESGESGVEVVGLDMRSREGWEGLLGGLREAGGLRGVVYLAGLRGQGPEVVGDALAAEVERVTGGGLALAQGLVDAGVELEGGLWMVTRGAQVLGGERGEELSGAGLWGLGRTLWWEAGELKPRLVDLDPAGGRGVGQLVDELLHPDGEREIAYRGGERRVLRLVRSGGSVSLAPVELREEGTYLVTGGMGGIGLAVAGWLAERGARKLVLNGRREPGEEAREVIEGLRGRGVEVRVELADVTDGEAVAGLVERVEGEMGPLAGVFHSVGVFSDGVLGNQDWESFERVMWPKVLGAWHLHRATMGRELELFVLFSSTAGVLGNPGQSNYAAANAFLDQLAGYRRGLGLAGQSIAWGAWSGVGKAEAGRDRIGGRLAAAGAGWMTPRQGLGALERVVGGGEATGVATMMDWGLFGAAVEEVPPLLEELVTVSGLGEGASRAGELLDRVSEAAASEREGLLLEFVQGELQGVLQTGSLPAAGVGFFDLGMDSLMAVDFRNRLNRGLGGAVVLSSTVVFDHGSAAALARHLAEELGVREVSEGVLRRRRVVGGGEDGIAVVGMACRFPGGGGVEGFWRLLDSGGDAITKGRGTQAGGGRTGQVLEGSWTGWGGFIEDVELFDAEFFRIAPVEARLLDPQHRLLLETSWEALESAGMDTGRLKGSRTGVYAGISGNAYGSLAAVVKEESANLYLATGNSGSAAIGRVAFTLGLEGPAVAVDTWCSSSLVAVHQAVSGLRTGDADLALAGGVNVLLSPGAGEFSVEGMLSPDGRCKTFDASANGFVRGEGCGVVVLKRLREAEADGDRIWGVIRGSAINHDGASAGLTVPNGSAQERVIEEALGRAGLEPWEVDYLEAHGTGTELGDPVEVHAAAAVYGAGRDGAQPLRVGSVKTNVGHLEAAAGVSGLIKVLLSMAHGVIPKHLHFREPSPHVEWERLPLRVASEPEAWPRREGRPARAAVSSFGASGTNAHVVVEGYGDAAGPEEDRLPGGPAVAVGWPEGTSEYRPAEGAGGVTGARERRLLPLAGRTDEALRALAARYAEWLEERAGLSSSADTDGGDSGPAGADPLADVAWTAAVGRSHHGRRAAVTFGGAEELREKLAGLAAGGSASEAAVGARAVGESGEVKKVAFLFTGQGSQWAGMGRELYRREPVFCAVLDRCEDAFRGLRGESLLAIMFGEGGDRGSLDDTRWTQPALYALEAGLAALWGSVGVRPAAVLGHSVGEIAAAYAAGVFSLEAGMRFAARRGELMGSLPDAGPAAGAMAAVFAPAAGVEALVAVVNGEMGSERLGMAAYNGAHQVVSGRAGAVEAMLERCAREGVRAERLRVSQGFHSVLMDPILDELEGLLAGVDVTAPAVALVSDVTGGVLPAGEAMDGAYWRRQAREPVAFGAGVAVLAGMGVDVLVELGPRPVLGGMAALAWPVEEGGGNVSGEPGARFGGPVVLTSLRGRAGGGGNGSSDGGFVEAVGGAYASGLALRFEGLFVGEERRRVSLPGYPFQRQRYWTDAPRRRRRAGGLDHPLLGERRELPGGETTFETELYATEPAWLSDHRVFGQVAAPGAMYGAMALSAASLAGGSRYGSVTSGGVAVEDVQIHAPLVLPEGEGDGDEPGRTVFVAVAAMEAAGSRPVKIYSKGEDEKEWTLHAEARTGGGDAVRQAPARLDVEALKKGLSELDTAEFYRGFAAAGVELGGSFRTVQGLWRGPGEAVGDVCLGEGWKDGEAGLHPVLLDGCFQVLGAALEAGAEEEGRGTAAGGATYLPFGWERLWVVGEMPERVTCHARVCGLEGGGGGDEGEGSPAEVVTADLWLYGDDGRLVGEVSGLVLKRASRSAFLPGAVRTEDLLYAPVWRKAGFEGKVRDADFPVSPAEVEEESGLWVLSSDDDGEGSALAEELARRNQRVVLAVGEGAAGVEGPGVRGVEVVGLDMRSRGGWHRLLEGLPEEARLRGVVHLGALSGHGSGAGSAELAADVERGTGSALALAQGLVDAGIEPSGGMWLVTRGAQVVDGERGGELSGSALWGLGKTLALEAGQLKPRLVDLDPEDETGSGVLVEELLHPDRETEVAYRGGSRRVLRLVRAGTRLVLPEGADWRLVSGADGLLESVRAERVPARAPGSGELRVAVEAAGLNFRDVMVALKLVDVDASLGGEFCGRVLEVGADVTGFSAGDRVVGFAPGGLGPEAVTRAEVVARAPAGMTPAELATVPVVFTTVALAFELSGLKGGERVLVHAGAGGVGLAAIQMAQSLGAEVYATASAPKRRYLESLGVAEVFDSRSTRFGEDVLGATGGEGVDVVLNSLTGEGFIEASLSCLKEGGRFVEIGKRGIWSEEGMRKARPDVDYHVLALDRLLEAEPGRVGRVLRGVTERVGAAELQPLRRSVWGMGEAVEAMEYMSSGRHVGKLVLRVSSGGLREDGTYLVTGGLGGIGLELAGWLADHGARSMVLNGRREPEGAAMAAVEALRERGVEVRVELADVADGDAVAAMLERMDRELPPLAGVFHSVGVLADGALGNQDWGRFERVLWPKVLGAWHLHRATEARELDLFVLFSSVTGVLGNAGQANYAAANAFLDQLARHRRALGMAGQSIAWGAWSEVGEAEERRDQLGERLAAVGAGWMTPRQGLGVLERVIRGGEATSAAMLVDLELYGAGAQDVPPLLEELVTVAAAGVGEEKRGRALLERLRGVRAPEREGLLLEFLQRELQAVLHMPSLPAAGVGFFDLGMDSLMAVEFRNRVNRGLSGVTALASTAVFGHASPEALARHLVRELGVLDDGPGSFSAEEDALSVSDLETERVQGLSEQEFLKEASRVLGEDHE